VRASRRERDETIDRLAGAYGEARLDELEFDHRLDRALSAPTRGELADLLVDLPLPAPATAPPPQHPRPFGRVWRLVASFCCCGVGDYPREHADVRGTPAAPSRLRF
jgi:hypothetical protein